MAMAQLYSDGLTEYAAVCTPLQDLGFAWIPEARHLVWQTTCFYANIADVWVAVTYVTFAAVLVPFLTATPWTCKTRFTWCLTALFALRTVTLLCTRYPRFPGVNGPYLPASAEIPFAAILILLGVRTTQTDYMFSGHVVGWTLTALFFWRHRRPNSVATTVVGVVFWLFNVTGMFLLVAVREHYTADVVVALALTTLVYTVQTAAVATTTADTPYVVRLVKWLEK